MSGAPALYSWVPDPISVAICQHFADSSDLRLYQYRGRASIEKVKLDIRRGKLAELAAEAFLRTRLRAVSPPDFNHYPPRKKSWAPDLTAEGGRLRFSVKSQTRSSAAKHGSSWVFQKTDRALQETCDYWCLLFQTTDLQVDLVAVTPIATVSQLLKPMKLLHLSSKKALYYEDLGEESKSRVALSLLRASAMG